LVAGDRPVRQDGRINRKRADAARDTPDDSFWSRRIWPVCREEPAVVLLIPALAIVALAALAMRTGILTRPASATPARPSPSQDGPAAPMPTAAAPAAVDGPLIKQLVWASALTSPDAVSFPTLAAIDSARDPGLDRFATDPHAALLERRARELTDRYWSEMVWLTGLIDQARFDAVCAALDRERDVRLANVDVLIEPTMPRVRS
jgi:hypothetical protein